MKTRAGFVSNSSSASFIVEIPNTNQKELRGILSSIYNDWNASSLDWEIRKAKTQVNDWEKEMSSEDYGGIFPNEHLLDRERSYIENLEDIQVCVREDNDLDGEIALEIEFHKTYLKHTGIHLGETRTGYSLTSHTCMFNDYTQVHKELQQLITLLAFSGTEFDCLVKSDDGYEEDDRDLDAFEEDKLLMTTSDVDYYVDDNL